MQVQSAVRNGFAAESGSGVPLPLPSPAPSPVEHRALEALDCARKRMSRKLGSRGGWGDGSTNTHTHTHS